VIVIADTSPLIYLSRAGVLHVLASLFGQVVVPRLVWDEAVTARSQAPGVGALLSVPWIRIDDRMLPTEDLGLDPGETAAIRGLAQLEGFVGSRRFFRV
jgi:predicted nucleic acid-binding protein